MEILDLSTGSGEDQNENPDERSETDPLEEIQRRVGKRRTDLSRGGEGTPQSSSDDEE